MLSFLSKVFLPSENKVGNAEASVWNSGCCEEPSAGPTENTKSSKLSDMCWVKSSGCMPVSRGADVVDSCGASS